MNHQRRSAIAEYGMGVAPGVYVLVRNAGFGRPVGLDGEILHVARVMSFRILEAMLLPIRIEVSPGGFEIGTLTLCVLMDMHGVLAGRKILQVQVDLYPGLIPFHGGGANAFSLGVLEFNSCALAGSVKPRAAEKQGEQYGEGFGSFHKAKL